MSLLLTAGGAGSPVNYVLTCASGSYTYTGVAASLKVTHSLVCSSGAYTYTGVAASLKVAHSLVCAAGAYALSGNAASLQYIPGAAVTVVPNSGVGGGTTGHATLRKRKWAHFTEERSRRYEELYQQLLAQELQLELAQETKKLTSLKKQQTLVNKIQLRISEIRTELVLLEAAAEAEEEHLMIALLLD